MRELRRFESYQRSSERSNTCSSVFVVRGAVMDRRLTTFAPSIGTTSLTTGDTNARGAPTTRLRTNGVQRERNEAPHPALYN